MFKVYNIVTDILLWIMRPHGVFGKCPIKEVPILGVNDVVFKKKKKKL